jgi:hypothetical protein
VWDHSLRYDFNSIETVNGTFFFRNNWSCLTLELYLTALTTLVSSPSLMLTTLGT